MSHHMLHKVSHLAKQIKKYYALHRACILSIAPRYTSLLLQLFCLILLTVRYAIVLNLIRACVQNYEAFRNLLLTTSSMKGSIIQRDTRK